MPELHYQDYPGPSEAAPLVLLHGLFGSSTNWRGVARQLSRRRRVLAMDMRNHGRSFNDDEMTYPDMAGDVLATLDAAGVERADVLGHSMGGKAAMVAALRNPGRVRRLVVVDIAPVIYTHSHLPLVDAMLGLDVSALSSRAEADEKLAGSIADRAVRQFLLQNLDKAEQGYSWRLNLPVLRQVMEDLVGFPEMNGLIFDGPILFLRGAESDYVQPEHRPRIERYFPNAAYAAVAGAGHWVHADQPAALAEHVEEFLTA